MLGCDTLPSRMRGLPAMSASPGLVVSCSAETALVSPGAGPGHNGMGWLGSAAQTCAVKRIPQPRPNQRKAEDFMRAVKRIPRQASNVIPNDPAGPATSPRACEIGTFFAGGPGALF